MRTRRLLPFMALLYLVFCSFSSNEDIMNNRVNLINKMRSIYPMLSYFHENTGNDAKYRYLSASDGKNTIGITGVNLKVEEVQFVHNGKYSILNRNSRRDIVIFANSICGIKAVTWVNKQLVKKFSANRPLISSETMIDGKKLSFFYDGVSTLSLAIFNN